MKLFFLFLFLLPAAVKAQFQQLDYGPVAGLNVSNIRSDGFFSDSKTRTAFYAGGFAEMPVIGKWGVRSEILYSAQGAESSVLTVDVTWKLAYLNIPIMVRYEVIEGLNLMTGGQLGILLSAKSKLDLADSDLEINANDDFKGADFAWVVGAEYRLEMGLGFSVRYNLGLPNILDGGIDEARNRVFQVGASFLLSEFINN